MAADDITAEARRTGVDPRGLSVVGRILLATDGTLTHILEAFAEEPIRLAKLAHENAPPALADELGLEPGERAVRRVILLVGALTERAFVYADSVVVLDRLPRSVVHGLLDTDRPIGKLLIDCRLETFRRILRAWEEPAGAAAEHLEVAEHDTLVARTYDILVAGRPIARITEKFPKAGFPAVEIRSGNGISADLREHAASTEAGRGAA